MLVTEDTFGFAFNWLKKRKLLNNGFVVNFQPCESDTDMTCLKVPCYLGRMRRGDQVKIQMMSRLWQNTLIKVLAVGQRNCAFRSCSCYTYLFLTDFKPLCFQAKAGSVNLTTTAKVAPPSSVSEPNEKDNVVKVCVSFSGEGQSWIILLKGWVRGAFQLCYWASSAVSRINMAASWWEPRDRFQIEIRCYDCILTFDGLSHR